MRYIAIRYFALLAFLSLPAWAQNPVRFAPAKTYTAGSSSYRIATGDLNGDKKPDLVVANTADQNVSVLINKGDGTFQSAVAYPLGDQPDSIVVGDFNKDNNLDVAVATYGSQVIILLGDGDGTLQAPIVSATNVFPLSLAVADINKDGTPDLLVGGNGAAAILLGQGDGTFIPETATLSSAAALPALAAADLNNDGRMDIVAGTQYAKAAVYLQNADGTFAAPVTYGMGSGSSPVYTAAVVLNDLNGDSKPDIIICSDMGTVAFLGNGDGTFDTKQLYVGDYNSTSLVVTDLNGDGIPDVATSKRNTTTPSDTPDNFAVEIDGGTGDGNTNAITGIEMDLGTSAYSIVSADFNGDGLPDLATANVDHIAVFLNGTSMNVNLSASPNPQPPGQAVTLKATVAPASGSGPVPTGTIEFIAGSSGIEPGHSLGTATLDSAGTATLSVPAFSSPDFLQAVYSGDATYLGSNAVPVVLHVGYSTSTTVTASATSVKPGDTVTLTASVTSPAAAPTGTVHFFDGSTALGTVTLASGSAQFTTAALSAGMHNLKAQYWTDSTAYSNQLLASSGSVTVSALNDSASAVALSGGTTAGSTVTITATVSSSTGVPTGTVTFLDGTTSLGTATLSNGTASLQTAQLAAGNHSITASYSGDTSYRASASSASPLKISEDFSMSEGSKSLSLTAGQSGTVTLDFAPQPGGFNSAIQLSCTGAPALSTCSVSPSTITPGNSSATAMVTVTTTAATTASNTQHHSGYYFAYWLPMLGLSFAGTKLTRKRKLAAVFILLTFIALAWTGCGGGGSSTNPPPTTKPGTAAGNYTLTLNATSGNMTHSTAIALTVK